MFIFLPVAAVVWIQYQKNVGSTDVFSRCCEIQSFFQPPVLSRWAGVQGLGGAQPGSDPSWAMETFRTTDGVLHLGMGAGWEAGVLFSTSFNNPLFLREFELFPELGLFRGISVIFRSSRFHNCCSGTGYTAGHWAARKIVLCVACFAY